jgi:hypothetical protein
MSRRTRFTPDEKLSIVLAGLKGEVSVIGWPPCPGRDEGEQAGEGAGGARPRAGARPG